MYAQLVQGLPHGKDWLFELKFNAIAGLPEDASEVTLWSRRGMTRRSRIAKGCEHLPPDTLLDGEIIALEAVARYGAAERNYCLILTPEE
jgi:hypothetical protein